MSANKGIKIFFPFRAFHNQTFNLNLSLFLILPILFNFVVLINLSQINQLWATFLRFYIAKLHLNANVLYKKFTLLQVDFLLPSIDIPADMPGASIWWATIIIGVVLFILSYLVSDSYTPFKYFLRAFISVLWITQLFFLIYPVAFPYDIRSYTNTGFLQIISLLFSIPWLYGFTYYLFGHGVVKKILVTSCALLYFIVLAPFQYLLNSVIIYNCSLMFMPVLYLFAGLLINIFSIIAFYAVGVSLVYVSPKFKK